jgi:hypothetical protein
MGLMESSRLRRKIVACERLTFDWKCTMSSLKVILGLLAAGLAAPVMDMELLTFDYAHADRLLALPTRGNAELFGAIRRLDAVVRRLIHDPLVDFEWGVFYFPPITEETSPYASGVDPSVIGGSGIQYSVRKT